MTTYPGINYAGPFAPDTNRDPKTGIRYGVIPLNDVCQAWCDSSEPDYPEPEIECPKCGEAGLTRENCKPLPLMDISMACPRCSAELESEFEHASEYMESTGSSLDDGKYKAFSDEHMDIFIIKSPYFTYAQFCSACAPGACHLGNPLSEPIADNKCYCFGHDFFEDSKAPYPVYLVSTGKLVEP